MATGHGSSLGGPKERRPNGRRRVEAIWGKTPECGVRVAGVLRASPNAHRHCARAMAASMRFRTSLRNDH
ncbi:hypothetical protein AZ78_0060 [Lysobacter capsici AZ78]|uniref:Uncharacterized protein n=1 Tax=Lysobacter capsici AZ78 TaxID=1444315 RepID=A0A108U4R2_9GAMM|nr:hypothetical protein AZ78_0060 [Lysobacter capsici AZ78]